MPDTPTLDPRIGHTKKLLVALTVAILLIMSFLGTFIFFLPKFVSTQMFKGFIENRASSVLNRRLQIETLKWEWTDDILIKNVTIADDPAFSNQPMVIVKRARIKIFFSDILNRRLHFDCILDGIHAGLIRDKKGLTNLGVLLTQFEKAKASEKKQMPMDLKNISFSVPMDIQGRIHINQVSVQITDLIQDKQLALKNAAIRFDIPSLYLKPITLKASTEIKANGNIIPSAHINILINNLFERKGRLTLTDASVDAAGACPGVEFVFSSDLSKPKISSRMEIDLLKVANIIEPFMPPQILPLKIAGNVKFEFHGNGIPQALLPFNSNLAGKHIVLAGGVWGDKTLGPLNFNVVNTGVIDPVGGSLLIESGALDLLEKSRLTWSGQIKDLYETAPAANFKFNAIQLHVGELFENLKGFLPGGIKFGKNTHKNFPILKIKDADFEGLLPSGPNNIKINDLVLKIPKVHYFIADSQGALLSSNNIKFTIKEFRSTLKDFFPTRMSLTAALITDSVSFKGEKEVQVNKLSISDIAVISDEIHRSENPLMGLTARFSVCEKLSVGKIKIPSLIAINNLKQSIDAHVALPSDANADIVVKDLKIQLPSLILENFRYGPFITSAALNCRIDNIFLLGLNPLDADIKGIKSTLSIDDIIAADFEADAENMALELLKAKGSALIDMAPLSKKFISKAFDELKLTGETKIVWDIAGRLPNGSEIDKLVAGAINMKDDLDFVDKINIDCRTKNMGVELSVSEENRLKIESVSTMPSVRYSFDKKTGQGQSDGKIMLRGIQQLPYMVLDKPLDADILVAGSHDQVKSVTYSQVTALKPANLNCTLDVSLSGLDRVLKRNLKMPFPLWLNYIAGTARGTLNVSEDTDLTALVDNLGFKGRLASGAEVQLVPAKNIRLQGWTTSSELDMTLGEIFNLKQLKANVHLKKDYRIIGKEKIVQNKAGIKPLSVSVLNVDAKPVVGNGFESDVKKSAVNRFIGELQNRFAAKPAVAFKSAYMGIGPLPLSVNEAMIGFDLNQGLPTSDYFKIELLGGTLIGSANVLQPNDAFLLRIQLAFSGLDAAKLSPAKDADDSDHTELSGQLWVSIPLSSHMGRVLRELQVDLNLNRIGPKSLERFLYVLDPFESNEAIVSQRQLLRLGFPRWINVNIKDGNLSIDGEVDVQGVPMAIPPLRRLNIANISGLEKYTAYLDRLMPVINVLKVCSAQGIKISHDGRSLKFQTIK